MATVESAEMALTACLRTSHAAEAEIAVLQEDFERIRAGGSMAPAVVRAFRDRLREAGIEAIVPGDELHGAANDAAEAAHAQAALGDTIWAVIVPAARYEQARDLAVAADYPWPVAPAGPGNPSGVLKLAGNDGRLGALLIALDAMPASSSSDAASFLEAGADATTTDGMRHGRIVSRMTPIRDHPMHPAARELAISRIEKAIEDTRRSVAESGAKAASQRERLAAAYLLLDAVRRLQERRQAFRSVCRVLAGARTAYRSATQNHASISVTARELFGRLQATKAEVDNLEARLTAAENRLHASEGELSALTSRRLTAELAAQAAPLPSDFTEADIARLDPASALEVRRSILETEVNDRGRFPDDIRDPVIVSQCEAEEGRLVDVEQLVADRSSELSGLRRESFGG